MRRRRAAISHYDRSGFQIESLKNSIDRAVLQLFGRVRTPIFWSLVNPFTTTLKHETLRKKEHGRHSESFENRNPEPRRSNKREPADGEGIATPGRREGDLPP